MLRKVLLSFVIGLITTVSASAQYCTPLYTYDCSWGDNIASFTLNGAPPTAINHLNSGCSAGGYQYFNTIAAPTLIMGNTYSGTINSDYSCCQNATIWIDFNNNSVFEPSEVVATVASFGTAAVGFTINIPTTVTAGTRRMRVRDAYSTTPPFDPCTSYSFGETQDYDVNIQAPINCSTATFPTAVAVTAQSTDLCPNDSTNITVTTAMPAASGITYQLQRAASAAGPWTNVGAAQIGTSFSTGLVTAPNLYYRVQVICNTTAVLTSNVITLTVVNPTPPSGTGGSRCGPGTVNISATGVGTIRWWDLPTGGNMLGTGASYTTPSINNTTTYYAETVAGGSGGGIKQVGNGTAFTTYSETGGPFNNYWRVENTQMLYTAADLLAVGATPGSIMSIAFNCGQPSMYPLLNYRIGIMTVPSTMTSLTWQNPANFSLIQTIASYTPTVGWQTFTLPTPLNWNGTDGIVIMTCMDQTQPNYSTSGGTHQYTTVSGRLLVYYSDAVALGCTQTGTSTATHLPNCRFDIQSGCASATRTPVVATVNQIPSVTGVPNDTFCANTLVTPSAFASSVSGTSYSWTNSNPSIGLPASGTGNLPAFTPINNTSVNQTASIIVTPTANGCPGPSTQFTFTVRPALSMSSLGSQALCAGAQTQAINFVGNFQDMAFTWTNSNTTIGLVGSGVGTSIPSFTSVNQTSVPQTANITVTPTRNGCFGTPQQHTITVNPNINPDINIASNAGTPLCAGTLVDFTSVTNAGGNNPSYTWFVNGNQVGSNSPTFSTSNLNNNDQVWAVYALSNTPCQSKPADTSNVLTFTVYPVVTPSVVINSSKPNNTICDGELVNFYAGVTAPGGSPAFEWRLNNMVVGNNSQNYFNGSLANGDVVTCRLISDAMCRTLDTAMSPQVIMSVLANPVPVITKVNENQLSTTTYASYQWFLNSTLIPGATTQNHTASQSGIYQVRVSNGQGCEGMSDPMQVVIHATGIDDVNTDGILIYPNPTKDKVLVKSPFAVDVRVYNVQGQIVYQALNVDQTEITNLADGIYQVILTNKEGQIVKKESVTKNSR